MCCTVSLLRIGMILLVEKPCELVCFLGLVTLSTDIFEVHCAKGHLNFCL